MSWHRFSSHHLETGGRYERPSTRHIVDGLQGKTNGVPREDGFDITVGSLKIMAILCLSENILDLKERLIASLLGTTTKDNQSQLKTQGWRCYGSRPSKMPSIQTWYKP